MYRARLLSLFCLAVGGGGCARERVPSAGEPPRPNSPTSGGEQGLGVEKEPLDPDAACINLPDDQRVLACGPRVAEEAKGGPSFELALLRNALEHVDLCAPPFGEAGQEGPFPDVSVPCRHGPRHRCVPTASPREPWEFKPLSNTEFPVLSALVAAPENPFASQFSEPTSWHRTIRWEKVDGACNVDFESVADLDGDGEFAKEVKFLSVRDGEVSRRLGPNGDVSVSVPEAPPRPIVAPEGFVPLPEAGCEELPERPRVEVCGPFKLQHTKEELLDFRDDSLKRFVDEGLCFHRDFGTSGKTQFYPPESVRCHEAPRGECLVAERPKEAWEYEPLSEASYPYWSKLQARGFKPEAHTYSSKQIRWKQIGGGQCDVELEAKGDLDGDGIVGRYTTHVIVRADGEIAELKDPGTMHPE